jgi:2-oxoisovalerate dehydrogenase E1 component alpha subunit
VKTKKARDVPALEGNANGTLRREPRRGAIEIARALGLDVATLKEMYRAMLRARMVDERCWLLNRGGKAPFVISCQGQEAAQVGSVYALDPARDWFAPYYRDLGVVLALGMTATDIFCSVLGKAADPNSGARQMPSHFGSRRRHIISQGSSVATQALHSVGAALAMKVRGEDAVSINYVGEGGTSQGDFHEAMNFASVHKLPVIFVVENNNYAISVPLNLQMAVVDVAVRAEGYGMPGVVVDGQDVLAMYSVTREAADRARAGDGPSLIEAKTHRFTSHSSDDDQRIYRDPAELKAEAELDPIPRFRDFLERGGLLDEGEDKQVRAELKKEIDAATEAAENSPLPAAEEALLHTYGPAGPSGEALSGMPRFNFGGEA